MSTFFFVFVVVGFLDGYVTFLVFLSSLYRYSRHRLTTGITTEKEYERVISFKGFKGFKRYYSFILKSKFEQ